MNNFQNMITWLSVTSYGIFKGGTYYTNMATQQSPLQLKGLKVICIALCAGATIFMIIAFSLGNVSEYSNILDIVRTERYILLAMTIGLYMAAKIVGDRILSGKAAMRRGEGGFEQRYLSSSIVRLAMMEAPVLFSAVILIQLPVELKQSDPITYLQIIPLFLLYLQAIAVYPTDSKVEQARQRFDSQNNG